MEAMTLAEALEATHDYSQLMRESQKHAVDSAIREWAKNMNAEEWAKLERKLADPNRLKTAEGFELVERHGRARRAALLRIESELRRAEAESVAKTPQNGAKA